MKIPHPRIKYAYISVSAKSIRGVLTCWSPSVRVMMQALCVSLLASVPPSSCSSSEWSYSYVMCARSTGS